ncbi:MAG: hypothetical protein JW983_00630 [Elusimicrobia bacterium]|nr:hypothetical protein [Elusimicrobiota bacterium]
MDKMDCTSGSCTLTQEQIDFIKMAKPSAEDTSREIKSNIKIKIFSKKDCINCKTAIEKLTSCLSNINPEFVNAIIYYDLDTLDGLTEAAIYTAFDVPTIIFESSSGEEIKRWNYGSAELSEQDLKNVCSRLS